MASPKRTLVCASGRGSNFQAVVRAIERGHIRNCKIIGLVTDRKETLAERFAEQSSIKIVTVDFASFKNRPAFDREILRVLLGFSPDLILSLGYMRIFPPVTVREFEHRIINLHPSLLPAFPGLHVHRQVLEYGARWSGTTVHFMDAGVDTGPVIGQRAVEVFPEDTESSLAERVLKAEHELIVQIVDLFCTDRLKVVGRKVEILGFGSDLKR